MAQEQVNLDDAGSKAASQSTKSLQLKYPKALQRGVSPIYALELDDVDRFLSYALGGVGRGPNGTLGVTEYKLLRQAVESVYKGMELHGIQAEYFGHDLDHQVEEISADDRLAISEIHETNKAKMIEVAADMGRLPECDLEPPFKEETLRKAYLEAREYGFTVNANVEADQEALVAAADGYGRNPPPGASREGALAHIEAMRRLEHLAIVGRDTADPESDDYQRFDDLRMNAKDARASVELMLAHDDAERASGGNPGDLLAIDDPEDSVIRQVETWSGESVRALPLDLIQHWPELFRSERLQATIPELYRGAIQGMRTDESATNSLDYRTPFVEIIAIDDSGYALVCLTTSYNYEGADANEYEVLPVEDAQCLVRRYHLERAAEVQNETALAPDTTVKASTPWANMVEGVDVPVFAPTLKDTIRVWTIVWYRGEVPRELTLVDGGLRLRQGDCFTALDGSSSRAQGWADASEHADATGKRFTVIDVTLRCSRAQGEDDRRSSVFDAVRMSDEELTRAYSVAGITAPMPPSRELRDLMAIVSHAKYQDLQQIKHESRTSYGSEPLAMVSIPHRHWDSIVAARSLTDPGMVIRLTPPGDAITDRAAAVSAPRDAPRSASGPAPG